MTGIHPHGYFTDDSEDGHYFDSKLALALKDLFTGMIALDLGCGKGEYVRMFRQFGIKSYGVDGNPHEFDPENPHVEGGKDLATHRIIGWHTHNALLSLEVGEHIPAEFESVFLDNVAFNATELIVLSWAVPGQGGRGHVNERPNEWVAEQMFNRGWSMEMEETDALRANASLPWFKNTLMVFRKDSK